MSSWGIFFISFFSCIAISDIAIALRDSLYYKAKIKEFEYHIKVLEKEGKDE